MNVSALFDLKGERVPAVRHLRSLWVAWRILDPTGERFAAGWFYESDARVPGAARSNDAKKGYYVGSVTESGKVVDNGIGETNLSQHYKILEGK